MGLEGIKRLVVGPETSWQEWHASCSGQAGRDRTQCPWEGQLWMGAFPVCPQPKRAEEWKAVSKNSFQRASLSDGFPLK